MKIDWKHYESPYFSPDKGVEYKLRLCNWREELRSYDDEKTEKWVLVFDVLKVDEIEYAKGTYYFVTGARSFAQDMKNIIERAEKEKKPYIDVILKYGADRQYRVVDMNVVWKALGDDSR